MRKYFMTPKNQKYRKQVELLLQALPIVARNENFALYGGTAINFFILDMPRLSVDIDLCYLQHTHDRDTALRQIQEALKNIKGDVEKLNSVANIHHKVKEGKLLITSKNGAQIKIEVNLISRGVINKPVHLDLQSAIQESFQTFCSMNIIPVGQLYGGKIRAALDRQHPRDLFDIKQLLSTTGITDDIRKGFIYSLTTSNRPIHEILSPNLQDQTDAMVNQFEGMTTQEFSYEEYCEVRLELIDKVKDILTAEDILFLSSFINGDPDWSYYNFKDFPAVKWKLQNIQKLKQSNPDKFKEQISAFSALFDSENNPVSKAIRKKREKSLSSTIDRDYNLE